MVQTFNKFSRKCGYHWWWCWLVLDPSFYYPSVHSSSNKTSTQWISIRKLGIKWTSFNIIRSNTFLYTLVFSLAPPTLSIINIHSIICYPLYSKGSLAGIFNAFRAVRIRYLYFVDYKFISYRFSDTDLHNEWCCRSCRTHYSPPSRLVQYDFVCNLHSTFINHLSSHQLSADIELRRSDKWEKHIEAIFYVHSFQPNKILNLD